MVTLKQLCEYYLECISIDNANDISVDIRPNSIDYAELDSFDLNTFNPNVTQLIQRISASPKQVLSYIGYPVLVSVGEKKQREAIPILLFETHINAGNVTISYPPQINKDFLKQYTSTPKKLGKEIIKLEKELKINSSTPHTLSSLVQELRQTRTWQWMEEPDPDNLNTTPLLKISQEGIYNSAILLSTNASPYTHGLEAELAELSQKKNIQNTALEEWLTPTITPQKTNPPIQVLDVYPMNREQRLAVHTALTNKLTVITGPPGTGKSQVVANIIANAAYHGKTVLFTSKNHKAVDVVVQRVQGLTDKNNLYPLIVRAGNFNPNLATILKNNIEKILSFVTQVPKKSIILDTKDNQKLLERSNTLDKLYTQKNDYIKLRNEVDALEQITTINDFREKWGDPLKKITSDEVLSFNEIKQSFAHTYIKWLKTRNSFWGKIFWFLLKKRKNRTLNQELDKLNNWLSQKEITPISLNINSYNTQDYKTIRTNLKFIYNEIRAISYFLEALEKLLQEKNLIELDKEITTNTKQIHNLSKTIFFNWLNSKNQPLSPKTKNIFNDFLIQLKANANNVWENFLDSIDHIITKRLLPACAITALSAKNKIPFAPGFFDLVIIDEASQCDIASALPMLYRAKQAVILGDPKQLSFISTINEEQNNALLSKYKLKDNEEYSFPKISLYDLAYFLKNGNAIKLLEHHRSYADIINFSNKAFYKNELRIATKYSNLTPPPYQKAIFWHDCEGITERPNGVSAINRKECQQIIRELNSLKQASYKGSIGIISPFRKQANYIREEIIKDKNLQYFLINEKIDIGTVHQFQGNEKDLIFFSPTISKTEAKSLTTFLANNEELFNVAITRARSQFVIVGNYQYCASCEVPHLKKLTTYLDELTKYNAEQQHPPFESEWEEKLYYALRDESIFTVPQHPVDQYRLDLAIILENGAKLDIEVDGENYHKTLSGEYCLTDLLRNQHLHDQGWDVKRFWVYQIRENLQDCINEIKDWKHTHSLPSKLENQNKFKQTNHIDMPSPPIPEAPSITWDSETWKQNFRRAVDTHNYQDIHNLRISVYQNTLSAVKNKGYISEQGNFIHLNNSESSILNTKFYDTELNPDFSKVNQYNTKISVINRDCLVLAKELVEKTTEEICVLNLANRQNPGGGVIKGCGAQEEYLFRCSDYFRSLYQFAPYAEQYSITPSVNSYPMDRNYGGVFSPNITIFRGPEEDGYPLLNQPWSINMIAVAAINRPNLEYINGEERIVPHLINAVKNKIRAIFRIARDNNQTILILGALGCGAFRNPPMHTAELFKEVMKEREFTGVFKQIYFAIKEDHNSRGIGNFAPFKEVFRDFEP